MGLPAGARAPRDVRDGTSPTLRRIAFIALLGCAHAAHAADVPWAIPDAPFRAVVKTAGPPSAPDCGFLIDLPEFGQTMPGLADVVLLDAKGQYLPLAKIFRGEGARMLLLAPASLPAESCVYFGGNRARRNLTWNPKLSLFLETRRMRAGTKLDDWPSLKAAWKDAKESDGGDFVGEIAHGENPFGENANFLSHYTGWLKTNDKKMTLFTLSSDASFVLVGEKYEFGWPGTHGAQANINTVPKKEIDTQPGATRIDYYHANAGGGAPTMLLGIPKGEKLGEAVPATSWLHPTPTEIVRIEQAQGAPVPIADAKLHSYIGWNGLWLYEASASVQGAPPAGWTAQWEWSDGAVHDGPKCERVLFGNEPLRVTLRLKGDKGEVRGVTRVHFGGRPPREASTENDADINRYRALLEAEEPAKLAPVTLRGGLQFLSEFGNDQQIAKWANAWMAKNPSIDDPQWIVAETARLRALSQTDGKAAIAELHRLSFDVQKKYAKELGFAELEILVFQLKDARAVQVASRLGFDAPNSDFARLAKIRVGDLHRLLGKTNDAIAQYRSVQKTIADETAGRKNAAQDRSYSITIGDMLAQGYRHESLAKLQEWELEHPMAKYESDFLLLRGRVLMEFGRWNDALQEIDSFRAMQPDSPWQIIADFHRARALFELGKKDEARKIWSDIAAKYPKHELAGESARLAKRQ